jgi:lysophospholipase L1-like esterase
VFRSSQCRGDVPSEPQVPDTNEPCARCGHKPETEKPCPETDAPTEPQVPDTEEPCMETGASAGALLIPAAHPLRRVLAHTRVGVPGPIRWLAIGDSITQGVAPLAVRTKMTRHTHPENGTCSYVSELVRLLGDAAPAVEFVGPFSEAYAGPFAPSCLAHRHAATWGITAEQVTSNSNYRSQFRPLRLNIDGSARTPLNNRGARVYDWARQHRPHVVSVLLGTNDLSRGHKVDELLNTFLYVLATQAIRGVEDAANADKHEHALARRWVAHGGECEAIVLLLALLPRTDEVNSLVEDFNDKLTRRDAAWLGHAKCVEVLNIGDGLRPEDPTQFYDGLHPAAVGEALIAHNVMRELGAAAQPPAVHNTTS